MFFKDKKTVCSVGSSGTYFALQLFNNRIACTNKEKTNFNFSFSKTFSIKIVAKYHYSSFLINRVNTLK